ncbi:hypothetical protein F2P81_001525 [Scophthalmus maximus]|uniref:Uncharacterized protein n=1 Tax=Scophthalmus maximus TaxID=52904 RepID=A0A6A4TBM1_SCOMX|nr:hypothetical protein F2P81_001525 [Scophthalmus maximus]
MWPQWSAARSAPVRSRGVGERESLVEIEKGKGKKKRKKKKKKKKKGEGGTREITDTRYNVELFLMPVLGKMLVVAERSSSPAPHPLAVAFPIHPSIQPIAPAAVSKQMSERVPTPLAELPKPPAAQEASAPALSTEASLSRTAIQ